MFVETSHYRWQVAVDGQQSDPPLVLLHGFAQSLRSFSELVPLLSRKFRVLRVDMPGHGQTAETAKHVLDWKILTDELCQAIELLDSRPAHWFGYSQGGRVAIMCLLAHEDRFRSLALLGASPGIANEGDRELRRQSDCLLGENIVCRGMAWFAHYWESLPIFSTQQYLPEPTRKLIRDERMACTSQGLKMALQCYGTGTMPDCFSQLTSRRLPLFLAAGELDTKFVESNARIAAASQSSLLRHHVFNKCGHAAHLERPGEFAKLLLDFFKSQ